MGRFYILQLSTHKASTTQTTYGERRNGRDGNCVEVTSESVCEYWEALAAGRPSRNAGLLACSLRSQSKLKKEANA